MFETIATLFAVAATLATPVPSQLSVENCQVGDIYAFSDAECQLAFKNEGDKPIRVFGFQSAGAADKIEPEQLTIGAHATVYAKAKINAANHLGGTNFVFHFSTDESGNKDRVASVFAFVMSVLEQTKPELDFGIAELSAKPEEKTVDLTSADVPDFRVVKVLDKPNWLDVEIDGAGRRLSAHVRPDAGWGIHADYIKLSSNSKQQPQVWVTAKADVRGEVVPSSNPFDLGLMRIGGQHNYKVPLESRSGKNFVVGKTTFDGFSGNVKAAPCEPAKNGCQLLLIEVTNHDSGTIQGHVWIDFPEFHQRLHLAVWGLMVAQDVRIKTLDPEKLAAEGGDGARKSSAGSNSLDLTKAVKQAVDSSETAVPPGNGPLLKWTVANGLAIHGFQIFRGDSDSGPFALLNTATVPSDAQTQDAVHYQYRDNTAKSGETYWYYIGIVYNDGHKQQLTGPQKVLAK